MLYVIAGLILLLLPQAAPGQGVPYRALVMDLSGQATATREGASRALEAGALLYPQEKVETGPGSSLTVYYPESGEEEQWPGGLKFTVGNLRSDPQHPAVKRRQRKVALPSLESPPGGMKVRGAPPPATTPGPSR
jgi:hypothetical protein